MANCDECGSELGGRWGNRCYTCTPPPSGRGKPRTPVRRVRSDGYVSVYVGPDHPGAHNGRVLEHRLVMEEQLGRALASDDHVHHKNGDRSDNRPENLEVIPAGEHHLMHPDFRQYQRRRITRACENCGKEYERRASRASETRFCSASCRSTAVSRKRWRKHREER